MKRIALVLAILIIISLVVAENVSAINVFSADTSMTRDFLYSGESRTYYLWVSNKLDRTIKLNVHIEGSVNKLLNVSDTMFIPPLGNKTVPIYLNTTNSAEPKIYDGYIIIESQSQKRQFPVTITISSLQAPLLKVSVQLITDKFYLQGEILMVL